MSVEQVTSYLTREILLDGKIVLFTLYDISPETLEAWAEGNRSAITDWPAEQPFLNIQDFTPVKGLTITPAIREKVKVLTGLRKEQPGRTAIVLANRLTVIAVQTILGLLTLMRRSKHVSRERKVFFSRDEAIQWVSGMLAEVQRTA